METDDISGELVVSADLQVEENLPIPTEALQEIVAFCASHLQDDPQVTAYLKKRNISKASIEQFNIGAWPNNPYIIKQNVDHNLLRAARCMWNEQVTGKETYKFGNHRFLIPIYDPNNRLIAITGRSLHSDERQKELHIPKYTSTKHNKRTTLFGLNFAKKYIREKNKVLVVEGNLDVVKAHQCGMNAVVAVTGAALTKEQAILLARYTDRIYVGFDNDEAGIQGTKKALLQTRPGLTLTEKRAPMPFKDLDEWLDSRFSSAATNI